MKKTMLVIAAGLMTLAACKKDNNDPPATGPTARALFVNATLHETALNVEVNDTAQQNATNLTFLSNNNYINIRSGASVKVGFVRASSQGEIASKTENFTTGSSYSVFAVGNGTTNSPSAVVVVSDDLTAPSTGMVKVRFANLSAEPDFVMSGVVTGTSGSIKLDSNITTNKVTPFREVAAGNYTITMAEQSNFQSKTLQNQNLAAGKIYTYIFTGIDDPSATGNAALKLTAMGNN